VLEDLGGAPDGDNSQHGTVTLVTLRIREFKGDDLPQGVGIAQRSKLWVPGYQATDLFRSILNGETQHDFQDIPYPKLRLVLAYVSRRPVAWILFGMDGGPWRFTKPTYRHQGISSTLLPWLKCHRALGLVGV
jgi:hypothetical protein